MGSTFTALCSSWIGEPVKPFEQERMMRQAHFDILAIVKCEFLTNSEDFVACTVSPKETARVLPLLQVVCDTLIARNTGLGDLDDDVVYQRWSKQERAAFDMLAGFRCSYAKGEGFWVG